MYHMTICVFFSCSGFDTLIHVSLAPAIDHSSAQETFPVADMGFGKAPPLCPCGVVGGPGTATHHQEISQTFSGWCF